MRELSRSHTLVIDDEPIGHVQLQLLDVATPAQERLDLKHCANPTQYGNYHPTNNTAGDRRGDQRARGSQPSHVRSLGEAEVNAQLRVIPSGIESLRPLIRR